MMNINFLEVRNDSNVAKIEETQQSIKMSLEGMET